MKILIFQPKMYGDIILGSTAAKYLKKKFPESKITYVTGCKALTETNPYIDISIERSLGRYENIYFNLIKILYDKSFFLLHWLPNDNILQSYMSAVGLERKNYPIKLYLTQDDKTKAKRFFIKRVSKNKKTIALQSDFGRKWNTKEFIKLKRILNQQFNVIEIGPNMMLDERVLNMREAAAVTSLCDVFVGGVSGNMHAAVAVGTPTICTPNVFDPHWDMPEFYQNEFIGEAHKQHITILPKPENFCGNYECVSFSDKAVIVSAGDYTPKICPSGFPEACVHSIKSVDIYNKIVNFFGQK